MTSRAATLDDLHAGAYVADRSAGALYEVLDRRSHREEPEADPVEQVRITDCADSLKDEVDPDNPVEPKWVPAEELVGMELVKAPQGAGTPRRTAARLA